MKCRGAAERDEGGENGFVTRNGGGDSIAIRSTIAITTDFGRPALGLEVRMVGGE
jgi:hypothetical protein